MDLREAREQIGLSERTLRRLIKEGKLEATMVGSGSNRHWEISEEVVAGIGRMPSGQQSNHSTANDRPSSGQITECPNCEWLKQHLEMQLGEKDTQIQQLHILLQQSQAALPLPRPRRWWWPFP